MAYTDIRDIWHELDEIQHITSNAMLSIDPNKINQTLNNTFITHAQFFQYNASINSNIQDLLESVNDVSFTVTDIENKLGGIRYDDLVSYITRTLNEPSEFHSATTIYNALTVERGTTLKDTTIDGLLNLNSDLILTNDLRLTNADSVLDVRGGAVFHKTVDIHEVRTDTLYACNVINQTLDARTIFCEDLRGCNALLENLAVERMALLAAANATEPSLQIIHVGPCNALEITTTGTGVSVSHDGVFAIGDVDFEALRRSEHSNAGLHVNVDAVFACNVNINQINFDVLNAENAESIFGETTFNKHVYFSNVTSFVGQAFINGPVRFASNILFNDTVSFNAGMLVTGPTTVDTLNVLTETLLSSSVRIVPNTRFVSDACNVFVGNVELSNAVVLGTLQCGPLIASNLAIDAATCRVIDALALNAREATLGDAAVNGALKLNGRTMVQSNVFAMDEFSTMILGGNVYALNDMNVDKTLHAGAIVTNAFTCSNLSIVGPTVLVFTSNTVTSNVTIVNDGTAVALNIKQTTNGPDAGVLSATYMDNHVERTAFFIDQYGNVGIRTAPVTGYGASNVQVVGTVGISGDVHMERRLVVVGNATFAGGATVGDLTASGIFGSNVRVAQQLSVGGGVDIGGAFNGGAATFSNASFEAIVCSGSATIAGSTSLSNVDIRGNVDVYGNVRARGNVTCDGRFAAAECLLGVVGANTLSVTNNATLGGAVLLSNTLSVVGQCSFEGIRINGALTCASAIIGNQLTINGETSVNNTLNVNGNFNVLPSTGTMNVNGTTRLMGAVSVNNTVSVTGNGTFAGNIVCNGSLSVLKDSTLAGLVTIQRLATFNNSISVQGNVAAIAANVSDTLTSKTLVANTITIYTDARLYCNVNAYALFNARSNAVCHQSITVQDSAYFNSNIQCTGNVYIAGNMACSNAQMSAVLMESAVLQKLTVNGNAKANNFEVTGTVIASNAAIGTIDASNIYIARNLIASNTYVDGTLNVFGQSTLTGLTVGDQLIRSNLNVRGTSVLSLSTTVGGDLSVYGNSTLKGENHVCEGNIYIAGISTVRDGLSVVGGATSVEDATVNRTLMVRQQTTLNGFLTANNGISVSKYFSIQPGSQCDILSSTVMIRSNVTIEGSAVINALTVQSLSSTRTNQVYVGANGALILNNSDKRLKRDVAPLPYSIQDVMRLRPVSYYWNAEHEGALGRQREIGLIAQEVATVIPEAVCLQQSGFLALDYSKMVPVLIQALQHMERRLTQLERG